MSRDLKSLKLALSGIPAAAFQTKLARIVALEGLESVTPHDWLFISGKTYRYNLAGAKGVYFSETRAAAQHEYDSYWEGLVGKDQPTVIYHANIALKRVLDLADTAVLKLLKIDRPALFLPWRTAKRPTLTQLIGTAALETGLFSAIRYPSAAAEALGKRGNNFVIFQDHVHDPDFVRIVGPRGKTLQQWP